MAPTTALAVMQETLLQRIISLASRLFKQFPHLVFRALDIAFNPKAHLRQLALVIAVQVLSFLLKRLRAAFNRFDDSAVKREIAQTYQEYLAADSEMDLKSADREDQLCKRDHEFFGQIHARRETYEQLVRAGDEYGLMFHLRSELMRRQTGGMGYNRDGSTWLRRHSLARDRIHAYQAAVCNALRFIASGDAPGSSRPSERLAFINETRHAFGRTALLLSGGAAFGVKHLGVIAALHREQLLPRIVCGTSAGSIVAAACCVRTDDELIDLVDGQVEHLLANLKFFGLKRGESNTDLVASATEFVSASVDWDYKRGRQHMASTKNLLDSSVLEQTIVELIGEMTFLEAFDKTGRVLNITVTRSDGRAPPLLCNYLTTPQLLVHSASLASCSIPGVFEAVELMARGRDGEPEPYFKTGGWRFTDGGLQADLPKERLTELFNVNQFIVSQVNPLAPLFVPVGGTGVPWLEELNVFLKHQLVGFVQGVSKLGSGKLFRPGGFRGVDLIMQDYEGTVTIRPNWSLSELKEFLANFDTQRIKQYVQDGERACWPHLPLIRSLCEVEFCLDESAHDLQRTLMMQRAATRLAQTTQGDAAATAATAAVPVSAPNPAAAAAGPLAAAANANATPMGLPFAAMTGEGGEAASPGNVAPMRSNSIGLRGKLPSYVNLDAYDGQHHTIGKSGGSLGPAYPVNHAGAAGSSRNRSADKLPGVASTMSLLALGAEESVDAVPSVSRRQMSVTSWQMPPDDEHK